jgi:hypothetical protein
MWIIARAGAFGASTIGCLLGLCIATQAAMMWGVNGHPLVSYPGVSFAQQLDLVKELGAHAYRVDVTNVDQAPQFARLLGEAKARDIEILPILIPPVDLAKQTEGRLYDISKAFAETFGRRFKGQVPVWELSNEIETYALINSCEMRDDGSHYPCQWGLAGGVGALDYYGPRYVKVLAVLRGLSDGIRETDPSARSAIGTSGWGHIGILQRYKQDGLSWDITVWHMYGQDPEWAFKLMAPIGKPIWITELGTVAETGPAQAAEMKKWMDRLEALAPTYHIEAAFIYELLDETYWGSGPEATRGLVTLVKAPSGGWTLGPAKPAFAAVQESIADALKRAAITPR